MCVWLYLHCLFFFHFFFGEIQMDIHAGTSRKAEQCWRTSKFFWVKKCKKKQEKNLKNESCSDLHKEARNHILPWWVGAVLHLWQDDKMQHGLYENQVPSCSQRMKAVTPHTISSCPKAMQLGGGPQAVQWGPLLAGSAREESPSAPMKITCTNTTPSNMSPSVVNVPVFFTSLSWPKSLDRTCTSGSKFAPFSPCQTMTTSPLFVASPYGWEQAQITGMVWTRLEWGSHEGLVQNTFRAGQLHGLAEWKPG